MRRAIQNTVFCAVLAPVLVSTALATKSVTMTFSKPMNQERETVLVGFRAGNAHEEVTVWIEPNSTAMQKRMRIQSALEARGYTVEEVAPNQLKIKYLADGTQVVFVGEETGEEHDEVVGEGVPEGNISMGNDQGYYEPQDWDGQVAVFTAGFVTDLGAYWVQLSAQELQYQTDPVYICQRLFTLLQPVAPRYGVEIAYAGDELEFYFDLQMSVNNGVIFGTTSTSAGFQGSVKLGGEPNTCPGDLNGDGQTGQPDLGTLLADWGCDTGDCAGDLNGDGDTDQADLGILLADWGCAT